MTTENQELMSLPAPDAVPPVHPLAELYKEEGYTLIYDDLIDEGAMLSPDWGITSADDADALLNQLMRYEDELARRKAAWERFERQQKAKIDWFKRRYASELQAFAARQLLGKKEKTVTLPCGGQLYFRNVPKAIEVVDQAAYENWVANELPDAVDFVPKIDKTMVNKYVEKLPQMPPGLAVRPAEERFYFK